MTEPDLLQITMEHSELLIKNARAGDAYAFNRLVSLWYKRIYNFCYKYFGSHDAAMEASQKTFIAVHKSFQSLQSPNRFKPWLYKIALNKCHEEDRGVFRKKMVSMFANATHGVTEEISSLKEVDTAEPDKKLQKKELAILVTKCLNKLSADQRVVVIMKEYEGLKFREIAVALDISENTVKSRLYYALTALRKLMIKMNVNQETLDYEL